MRILLDECLPRPLAKLIPGHHVRTVPQAGWAGRTNGELLSLLAGNFDIFVTVDRNLAFQQRDEKSIVPVVILHAESNRLEDLEPLVPELLAVLPTIGPNQIIHIGP